MTAPAFVLANGLPPERPSLVDNLSFGAFQVVPLAVRPHLRPEPWAPWTSIGCDSDALLIDRRDPARLTAREVSPEIAAAVYWAGEA